MKVLIVDDEAYARSSLYFLLQENCPQIEHIEMADSVALAVQLLDLHTFEVIFLDIAMPHQNGFELLPHLQKSKSAVVFTTAYDQYAIRAIKASAVDYLLKPIDIDELKAAVVKVFELNDNELFKENLNNLAEQVSGGQLKKMTLPGTNGSKIVDVSCIVRVEADSNYSTFYFTNQASITVAKSLKEYEEILPEKNFFRVHKSSIVNLDYVQNYNKSTLEIVLQNNDRVMVSRRRLSDFLNHLKEYSYN